MDLTNPDDLEVEVTARAYKNLREMNPAVADRITIRDVHRAAFEAGIAAGCVSTLEVLAEAGYLKPPEEQADEDR